MSNKDGFDANDPKQVQDAKTKAGRLRAADNEVIQKLMADPNGRSWIYRFFQRCHIYTTSAEFESGSGFATFFREGERNIGNSVLIDVQRAASEQYLLMMKESADG